MPRSEPKPKIVYRNLQQVIQRSSLHKKSASKTSNTTRNQQRCALGQISNKKIQQSSQQKKKIHFITKNKPINKQIAPKNYCDWYHQIDAIFTQLQDHLLEVKSNFIKQIDKFLLVTEQKNGSICEKVDEINKMSEYIKQITNYFMTSQIMACPSLSLQPHSQSKNIKKNISTSNVREKIHTLGNHYETQMDENSQITEHIFELSMKNNKGRANRRTEALLNRKKTVYELILQQKQHRARLHTVQNSQR